MNKLTQKQETFCINYFKLGNATEAAKLAGYKPKNADVIASQNLNKLSIKERLKELRQKVEDASIADVKERRQVLTEIVRARQTDFMTCSADGVWMHDIGKESMNTAALKQVQTTTMPFGDKDDNLKVILTKVELHNPMQAIDLLNKMDKIYSEGQTVNIDNRKLEIIVTSEKSKELLKEITEGKLPHANN